MSNEGKIKSERFYFKICGTNLSDYLKIKSIFPLENDNNWCVCVLLAIRKADGVCEWPLLLINFYCVKFVWIKYGRGINDDGNLIALVNGALITAQLTASFHWKQIFFLFRWIDFKVNKKQSHFKTICLDCTRTRLCSQNTKKKEKVLQFVFSFCH